MLISNQEDQNTYITPFPTKKIKLTSQLHIIHIKNTQRNNIFKIPKQRHQTELQIKHMKYYPREKEPRSYNKTKTQKRANKQTYGGHQHIKFA